MYTREIQEGFLTEEWKEAGKAAAAGEKLVGEEMAQRKTGAGLPCPCFPPPMPWSSSRA